MSKFIADHKLRASVAAAIVTAGVASASLAGAQAPVPPPDGGPPEAQQPPITTTCGPNLSSTVVTRNSPIRMNAPGFLPLPGAHVENIFVPPGESRCIKVLFTAETACGLTANPDFCYVRAVLNGNVPMDPNGSLHQAIDSEDDTASAHAYEWVKKVGPGNYNVDVEWRVLNVGTDFTIDDWTTDVEVSRG
jgi:hypothetical protein